MTTMPSVHTQTVLGRRNVCFQSHPRRRGQSARTRASERDVTEIVLTTTATSSRSASNSVAEVAASCCSETSTLPPSTFDPASLLTPTNLGVLGGLALAAYGIKKVYDTPSRTYNQNVGEEYDAWATEGILEYYWGEHIHLGYYTEEERAKGAWSKDFIGAKFDFVDKMLEFSRASQPKKILDVGCGIGGTSRHIAKKFPEATVQGITLSPQQVARGTQLAKEQGVPNASFQVMDALAMEFPDDTFDLVWACESGEHMPDKKKYVEEMARVLKPGGTMVIACWCQREETPERPLTEQDKSDLQFLYDEWAHPYFISIEEFVRLMQGTSVMEDVESADWTPETIPSWRHSVWVGVLDPWPVVKRPHVWYKTTREIVTLERMHRAFDRGLMQYGMIRGTKMPDGRIAVQVEGAQQPVTA